MWIRTAYNVWAQIDFTLLNNERKIDYQLNRIEVESFCSIGSVWKMVRLQSHEKKSLLLLILGEVFFARPLARSE